MTLHISLNGKDIAEYGITPTDGFLNVLCKPAGLKKIVTNANAAFDGVVAVITSDRKRDSRSFTLNFYIKSTSLIDRTRDLERLEAALIAGKNNSGVNELYVAELEKCYRIIYENPAAFNSVVGEKAIVGFKFMEYCPTEENRQP